MANAHTGSMRRHAQDNAESEQRQERFVAYLADAHTSDEEKGVIALVMLGHAGVYLLLAATEVTWVALTAARVLRRRDDGLRAAVRAGVHTPTLAAFVAANLGYAVLRRATLARIDRRIGFRP
jgi:predicted component of type VI protein secretion system